MAGEDQKTATPASLPRGSAQPKASQQMQIDEPVTKDTSHLSDARYRSQSPDPTLRK